MGRRIVLFGATGYTGRLAAEALAAAGARPVLAGRNASSLRSLATDLGGLDIAVADVADPATVRALVERDDVLVSTVGPFIKFGEPAVRAAIDGGASYLDATGEPPFIRQIFDRFGPEAAAAGVGLVTAFGYDWVPGNLAGALALKEAGDAATRVEIAYFVNGPAGPSGGTKASVAGLALAPSYAFRDGQLRTERSAARVRTFEVGGKERQAVSVGGTEHFGLPRMYPNLTDVDVYLGWLGGMSRVAQAGSLAGAAMGKIPGVKAAADAVADRMVKGSNGGPDAATRAKSGSDVIAVASNAAGDRLAEVRLSGVDGYTFTARILAWGATTAAERGLGGVGALAPADAFGLDALREGVERSGLTASVRR